jgi:hypothetical protein
MQIIQRLECTEKQQGKEVQEHHAIEYQGQIC